MSTVDDDRKCPLGESEEEVEEAMEELVRRDRKAWIKFENEAHETVQLRLKEQMATYCNPILDDSSKCATSHGRITPHVCDPITAALVKCFSAVYSEENRQQIRIQFLHGELCKWHQSEAEWFKRNPTRRVRHPFERTE